MIKLVYWYLLSLCHFLLKIRDFFRQCHSISSSSLLTILAQTLISLWSNAMITWCKMQHSIDFYTLYAGCLISLIVPVQNEKHLCSTLTDKKIKIMFTHRFHFSSVTISKIKVVLAELLGVLVNHCKCVTCFSELSWNSCHIIVVAMLSSNSFIKVVQSC